MVFNKIDRFENRELLNQYLERFPGAVGISAKTGEGVAELMVELGVMLRPVREFLDLSIPHEASAVVARLHAVAQVVERDYSGDNARFKARIPPHLRSEFAAYVVPEPNGNGANGLME
jgi:GTP-binding protein HflX